MGNKPWNKLKHRVTIPTNVIEDIKNFYYETALSNNKKLNEIYKKMGRDARLAEIYKISFKYIDSINFIKSIYDEGYGLKVIARELNLSYTIIRTIFDRAKINIRRGRNVVTSKVKEFRSARVKGNLSPWYNWPKTMPELANKISKGICGFYTNKSGNKYYLRSTWEYIYAKWLDKNEYNWSFEGIQYKLSNGESYRPDFNILDDTNTLKYIVEVKGFFKNRVYKIEMFRKEYSHIPIILVDNIQDYCQNYYEELNKWKKYIKLEKLKK